MVNVRTEIHMTSFVSCELYLSFQLEICFLHSTLFFGSNLIVLPKMRRLFAFSTVRLGKTSQPSHSARHLVLPCGGSMVDTTGQVVRRPSSNGEQFLSPLSK